MSLSLDNRTTALVLIDLQKGILSMPLATHSGTQVVENAVTLGRHFRKLGATVVLTHVAYSNDSADKLNQAVDVLMPAPPGGFGSQWSDFAPEIESLRPDVVITKRQWSAFYGTELDLQKLCVAD